MPTARQAGGETSRNPGKPWQRANEDGDFADSPVGGKPQQLGLFDLLTGEAAAVD
jgi:hypothetical protein